ncbi:gamma subclass chorismate mutase AroQ [Gordonia terrae]|uniref:chorismate mutase n=2 Tax=Gordonia terrae TaxID=2055 RepID=A0AAD0K6T4_9ACTN|nr:gamma subclass chorismate mutase AroQ [Gordonia terrae]VTR10065.1 Secreted chorismate mutase precursor [Clostridioides difficile]ANY23159.1 chorismate mutase [Gordonia terrae]AWO83885.1 gamma subclass chorismate mutase AroQ [Gordonia terrae]VTS48760.1 Secreted chorismate mutase precursor [Gordonia terrae]GAB42815.1 putative chorismate mutase [Gordonia terrae NBRC 100016]
MRMRGFLVGLIATVMMLLAPPLAGAAPSTQIGLTGLTEAMAGRLALADSVAATKWASGAAIDDPAREQVVLDTVSQLALDRDLDPAYVRSVFRDQIEASKTVQRGLFARWQLPGQTAPPATPDLGPVRTAINAFTVAIVDELAAARGLVTSLRCPPELVAATGSTAVGLGFDPLHIGALIQAGSSVCAVSTGSS